MANAGTYNHTKQHFAEGAAAGTPDSGEVVVYAKTDGLLYSKDDAGAETLMSSGAGGGGAVATDAIWDAAGDLAVGSGANTAARLALGAAGGAVSRVNGAVAWNSGTSFPTAATGDRYWRTDLAMEFYYDGTRWLSVTEYTLPLTSIIGAMPFTTSPTDALYAVVPTAGNTRDIWMVSFDWSAQHAPTLNGSHYWTLNLRKAEAWSSIVAPTTAAGTASVWQTVSTAIGAALGTTTPALSVECTKTGSPGALYLVASLRYRIIAT